MKNIVTGRVIVQKSEPHMNRDKLVRFLKDATDLAGVLSAVAKKEDGKVVVSTNFLNDGEAIIVLKSLVDWWVDPKTIKARELANRFNRAVKEGRLVAKEGTTDGKILVAMQEFIAKVLPLWKELAEPKRGKLFTPRNGVYAKTTGSQVVMTWTATGDNRWSAMANKLNMKGQPTRVMLDASTFKRDGMVSVLNKVVFQLKKDGPRLQYRDVIGYQSSAFPFTVRVDFATALILLSLSGINLNTMAATESLHYGVQAQHKKDKDTGEWSTTLKGVSPFTLVPEVRWGVTQGKNVLEGYAAEFREVAGWLIHRDYTKPEGLMTMSFEAQQLVADMSWQMASIEAPSKIVARINKLCKGLDENNQVTLENIFVVNEVLEGDKGLVEAAFGTGVIYVPHKTLAQYGQCRVVSEAKDLGLKGTFSSVAFLSQDLEKRGVTVLSFGSAKGNAFGIEQTEARADVIETSFQTIEMNGEEMVLVQNPVKLAGFWLQELTVVATNQYLIQSYMPSCTSSVVNSWAEATGQSADKALAALDIYKDNPMFVKMVKDFSLESGLSVGKALKKLEEEGMVKEKSKTTTLTPTEFDTMATFLPHLQVKALINDLVKDKLNAKKKGEYQIIQDFLNGATPSNEDAIVHSMEEVFELAYACMLEHEQGLSVFKTKTPNRNFLVSLVNGLYKMVEDRPTAKYMVFHSPDGNYVAIPTGKFFEGQTFESSAYLSNVVTNGFLSHMLPYLQFGVGQKVARPAERISMGVLCQTVQNLANLLESNLLGKDVGRLNAKGGYFVLSVAPWFKDNLYTVFAPSAEKFKKGSNGSVAMVTKHPAIFWESHCGAVINSDRAVYKLLVGDSMTSEQLDEVLESLGNTAFCHPDMLFALQNDSDGDLVRLTWHGVNLPLFEGKVLKDDYVLSKFHQKYKNGELSFLGKGTKPYAYTIVTQQDLYEGCLADPAGKQGVSMFTSYSQRFAQMFGFTMAKEDYFKMQAFMGMWIQEFAMNTMKHKSKGDQKGNVDIAEVFYRKTPPKAEASWLKDLRKEALEVFRNFEKEYGVPEQSEEFILNFFDKVREMLCDERSVAVTAMSRDRDVTEVDKESLRGAGFYPNPNASMMEYLAVAVLSA